MSGPEKKSDQSPESLSGKDMPDSVSVDNPYDSIFEPLGLGMLLFNEKLEITGSNPIAEKLFDTTGTIDESLSSVCNTNGNVEWSVLLKNQLLKGRNCDCRGVTYTRGDHRKSLDIHFFPLKDTGSDQVIAGRAIISDITETSQLRQQLEHTHRLATVGKIAGRVAHELNNPLDGILRYVNLAIRVCQNGDHDKAGQYLQQSKMGLMRMVQIVGELLEFSRSNHSSIEQAPLDQIISEAVNTIITNPDKINVQVINYLKTNIPRYNTDNLFQVFCNLIKNAVDAMQGQGNLKITIFNEDSMLLVDLEDTGTGFLPEHSKAIFEPFFTTKETGKGTGLGLAICRDILAKYGGKISAKKNKKIGSTFTVTLPLNPSNKSKDK